MPESKSKKISVTHIFRKQGNINGVAITGTPKGQLLMQIEDYLKKLAHIEAKKAIFITTPNPEQVVIAQTDAKLKSILKNSDISLCDGIGLLAAYEYFFRKNKYLSHRSNSSYVSNLFLFFNSLFSVLKNGKSFDGIKVIKGRDFFLDLLQLSEVKKYKVFLLGSTKDVLSETVNVLSEKYPSVHFQSDYDLNVNNEGVPVISEVKKAKEENIIKKINNFKPDLFFVAFGSPKQEKWVYRNLDKLNVKLIMVVGSTFDYIAGTRKSVPSFVERMGAEWLWRLFTGSQKWGRVYNAMIKFPYMVIKKY